MSVKSVLTTVADKIRSYTGKTDKLKLDEMPTEIEAVYNAGKSAGGGSGSEEDYQRGYEEGRQAQYDEFWDSYQRNGTLTNYQNAFSGLGWTVETFKPKYDIISKSSYMLFRQSHIQGDLGEILRTNGKRLVFDIGSSDLQFAFNSSLFTVIDGIEFVGTFKKNFGNGTFGNCAYLRAIKTPLPVNENTVFSTDLFFGCKLLAEVHFEGTIAKSIIFKDCPLSVDSMIDIINHLKSNWADGGALTQTLTFSDSCWDALENSGRKPDDANENFTTWRDYLESNKGWITA